MRALVEIQRTQIILAKRTELTANLMSNSYAFALDKRMCPVFETDDTNPLEEGYTIKRQFINQVLKYCADKWNAGEILSFYGLEAHFNRNNRLELIFILRYAFLRHWIDDKFFQGIASSCPGEAHGINDPFDVNEIGII